MEQDRDPCAKGLNVRYALACRDVKKARLVDGCVSRLINPAFVLHHDKLKHIGHYWPAGTNLKIRSSSLVGLPRPSRFEVEKYNNPSGPSATSRMRPYLLTTCS